MNEKLMELFEKANQDPTFKMKLLTTPEVVFKEFDVDPRENAQLLQRLKEVGTFVAKANEIINGRVFPRPNPVFYPVDFFQKAAALDLFKNLYFGPYVNKKDWIFYPADVFQKVEEVIEKRLQISPTALAARQFNRSFPTTT
jgi:hypothetical protein